MSVTPLVYWSFGFGFAMFWFVALSGVSWPAWARGLKDFASFLRVSRWLCTVIPIVVLVAVGLTSPFDPEVIPAVAAMAVGLWLGYGAFRLVPRSFWRGPRDG